MTPCIEYRGCRSNIGYGLRFYAGKTRLAHRVAYCESSGTDVSMLPSSVVIKHSCDNRACVNPEHLSLGTQADNCKERSLRGPRGEKCKLTAEQVLHIRGLDPGKRGRTAKALQLGEEYMVDESTIRNIWYGKYWGYA